MKKYDIFYQAALELYRSPYHGTDLSVEEVTRKEYPTNYEIKVARDAISDVLIDELARISRFHPFWNALNSGDASPAQCMKVWNAEGGILAGAEYSRNGVAGHYISATGTREVSLRYNGNEITRGDVCYMCDYLKECGYIPVRYARERAV